jgi:hypothetical protein
MMEICDSDNHPDGPVCFENRHYGRALGCPACAAIVAKQGEIDELKAGNEKLQSDYDDLENERSE